MASKPEPALAGDPTTPPTDEAAPLEVPADAPTELTREQQLAAVEADAYARAGHNNPVNEPTETTGE